MPFVYPKRFPSQILTPFHSKPELEGEGGVGAFNSGKSETFSVYL